MKYRQVVFISPPFYSHFKPLIVLAKTFKRSGSKVTFACSREFKEIILGAGLDFYELDISKNRNVGSAEDTLQADAEKNRLDEFFEATRKGAVQTLITQSKHRKDDMLDDPGGLIDKIARINDLLTIDLFIVDILSYGVTLSLYCLNLPFVTFCPPHPATIPASGADYGVPKNWPSPIKVKDEAVNELRHIARASQREFTRIFNRIIGKNRALSKTENAFGLVSEIAIIYNYFDFDNQENQADQVTKIFIGNCFEEEALDQKWLKKIKTDRKKIMLTLGTFLANRKDVLEKLICLTQEINPQALLIVSAGAKVEDLKKYQSPSVLIEGFIPQIALMPYVDTVIFHGGCNTFTEAMYYGKELIILPFSSDQFNIAYDVEKNSLGCVLDPNNFSREDLVKAFKTIKEIPRDNLDNWSKLSRQRGADYALSRLTKKK